MGATPDLTRRGFLQRTGTLATGLTAAAISGSLTGDALAQNARRTTGRRPQRVVVIGVDHYHATSTPNYLRILQNEKVDILGVHAPDAAIATKWAGRVQQHALHRLPRMIDKTKPEFVVALGRHVAMPAEFRFLVDTGIPFLMEKPWGIDDRTVTRTGGPGGVETRLGRRADAVSIQPVRRDRPSRCDSATSSGRSRTCSSGSISRASSATSISGARGCCRRRTRAGERSSISASMASTCFATHCGRAAGRVRRDQSRGT